MIVFELRCANDHHFEAWFKDGAAYEAQAAAHAIACPHCADHQISKAIMAPRIAKSSPSALKAEDQAQALRQALVELRQQVEDKCTYVGDQFADQARKIHYGEVKPTPIYGEASPDQVESLHEEGIAVQPIPWVPKDN